MDILHVYLLNLVITVGLFLATLYRIKIERDMIKTTMENAEYKQLINDFKARIIKEKDIVKEHCSEEFYDLLMDFFGSE